MPWAPFIDAAKQTEDDQEDPDESVSARFVNKLLKHLLSGSDAKDKVVRYRVLQLIVSMINGLGEIE